MAGDDRLHINTPYISSYKLSQLTGLDVKLKLDCLQASGSFKDRGMLRLCQELKAKGTKCLISSSGGNAGHAVAYSGRVLGMEVLVVVPVTTKPIMVEKIKEQGAVVEIRGENWNAADEYARKLASERSDTEYVHPFDHPTAWEGHSSIVDEIAAVGKPDAIICVVGGGGLLCGIYQGLERHGWDDVTVVTSETEGAASFAKSHEVGSLVRLDAITSIATSLGALQVAQGAVEGGKKHRTIPCVVTDAEAVEACVNFAKDHRILVEPACGAGLALLYTERFRKILSQFSSVAVVVCGGGGVDLDLLGEWQKSCNA